MVHDPSPVALGVVQLQPLLGAPVRTARDVVHRVPGERVVEGVQPVVRERRFPIPKDRHIVQAIAEARHSQQRPAVRLT